MAFKKVEVPAGAFMGWSNSKAGQIYQGHVVEYDEHGGTDFKNQPCPLLVVTLTRKAVSVNKENDRTEYEVGEELSLTAGQANLKKSVKKAHRDYGLNRGVEVRIELDHFEKVPEGKVKIFDVQVDTSTRDTSAPADDGDDTSGAGGGADDDEPPF